MEAIRETEDAQDDQSSEVSESDGDQSEILPDDEEDLQYKLPNESFGLALASAQGIRLLPLVEERHPLPDFDASGMDGMDDIDNTVLSQCSCLTLGIRIGFDLHHR